MPSLDGLEAAVADQIREQRQAFESQTKRARVTDGDLASAYSALGRLCHAYEFFDAAEASYANAIRLAPRDATLPHLLGYLYQQTGRFEDALARYSDARRLQPNNPVISAYLADVYLRLNRLADARALFQDLIEVYPAVARAGLGEIALRDGRFSEAVQYLEAALDRAPDAASVHYSLGMAYRRPGQARPGAIPFGAARHERTAAGRSDRRCARGVAARRAGADDPGPARIRSRSVRGSDSGVPQGRRGVTIERGGP